MIAMFRGCRRAERGVLQCTFSAAADELSLSELVVALGCHLCENGCVHLARCPEACFNIILKSIGGARIQPCFSPFMMENDYDSYDKESNVLIPHSLPPDVNRPER